MKRRFAFGTFQSGRACCPSLTAFPKDELGGNFSDYDLLLVFKTGRGYGTVGEKTARQAWLMAFRTCPERQKSQHLKIAKKLGWK